MVKRYRFMPDGMVAGTALKRGREEKSGVEVMSNEVDRVKKIFKRASGRDLENDEISVFIKSLGQIRIVLRKHKYGDHVWYINVDGNPTRFLIGNNIYGVTTDVGAQIEGVFRRCLREVEKKANEGSGSASEWKFPQRIWDAVATHDIHLNQIELATYTGPLADKKKVLNGWKYMFRKANVLGTDGMHKSLDEMLGVWTKEYENSFQVHVRNTQKRAVVMWQVYDKEEEVTNGKPVESMAVRKHGRVKGNVQIEPDIIGGVWKGAAPHKFVRETVPDDIKDRLRLEIAFTSVWFNNRDISTLAEMEDKVIKKLKGGWSELARVETEKLMKKACLIEMWTFNGQDVLSAHAKGLGKVEGLNPNVPTDYWLAILDARNEITMGVRETYGKIVGHGEEYESYRAMTKRNMAANPVTYTSQQLLPSSDIRVED